MNETEKKQKNKKGRERKDPIKKNNLKISMEEYTKAFNDNLSLYVKNYTKEKKEKYKTIYNDTGISKTGFTNYLTDRLPRYTETLIMIKDYFELPFSYLFGETSTTSVDEANIDISMIFGLDDKAMASLKAIKSQINNGTDKEKCNAYIKQLLVNTLISDNDFLDSLVNLFSQLMQKELINDSYRNIEHKIATIEEDYINYLRYVSYEKFVSSINGLIENQLVSNRVIESSENITNSMFE